MCHLKYYFNFHVCLSFRYYDKMLAKLQECCQTGLCISSPLVGAKVYPRGYFLVSTTIKRQLLKKGKKIIDISLITTVSVPLQPRSSMFQNRFLGVVQSEFCQQKVRLFSNLSISTTLENTNICKTLNIVWGWGLFTNGVLF